MKDKSLKELEEMVEERKWILLDWLNSGEEYDEIKSVADETELILIEIEERKKLS